VRKRKKNGRTEGSKEGRKEQPAFPAQEAHFRTQNVFFTKQRGLSWQSIEKMFNSRPSFFLVTAMVVMVVGMMMVVTMAVTMMMKAMMAQAVAMVVAMVAVTTMAVTMVVTNVVTVVATMAMEVATLAMVVEKMMAVATVGGGGGDDGSGNDGSGDGGDGGENPPRWMLPAGWPFPLVLIFEPD
jgi:hypothetical protein